MIKKILTNKELFWTFLYQSITLIGGIILIKLLATALSKETYGYYALVMSIVAFIVMMPFSALMQGMSRYISIYKDKNKYNNFLKVILIINLSLIFVYIIVASLYGSFSSLSTDWKGIYNLVIFYSVSEIIKILFRTINNTNRERKNLTISIFVEFSTKVAVTYILSLYQLVSIYDLLIIFIIANSLSIGLMLVKNKELLSFDKIKYKEIKVYTFRVWLFSYPLIIWAVFGWLRDMSNRWYIDYFLDKEQVALFAMMSFIAMIAPTALAGLISGFIMPILYQKENIKRGYTRKFLLKLLPSVFSLFIISFIITYIFRTEIILIIADSKYLEIAWMLPWMFFIFSMYTLSMMATYEFFAHKQTKKLVYSSILPGIISMICGYFFIKEYGIEGALYNYILTYSSYAILTFYIVFQYWKLNKYDEEKS
jgi:O-antigen/teichoic acid export membrane protein